MDILRFATAGSVDDGKSTLIGRLLYDSKAIFEDQLDTLERPGGEPLNLAMLTDGLRAERERGITIDVAYRYFATPRRKFIISDTPGHAQYTRNMVTGASTADLAVVLLDARNGPTEQSKRHAFLASLPGLTTTVKGVEAAGDAVPEVFPPMSATLRLSDDIDISRGDLICRPNNQPAVTQDVDAMVCWMAADRPLRPRGRLTVKHTSRAVRGLVTDLHYRIDVRADPDR